MHSAVAGNVLVEPGSKTYARDFFALPTDFWLSVYWVLLSGTLVYLLGFGSRALLVLRKDPRSTEHRQPLPGRLGSGMLACAVRIITALIPALQGRFECRRWCGSSACACGAGFALTSAQSWQQKVKWFQQPVVRS